MNPVPFRTIYEVTKKEPKVIGSKMAASLRRAAYLGNGGAGDNALIDPLVIE